MQEIILVKRILLFFLATMLNSYSCEYPHFVSKDIASVLFFDLDARTTHDYMTNNVIGLKVGTVLPWWNRVYSTNNITTHDINLVKKFFTGLSFKWWVDEDQVNLPKLLLQHGFVHENSLHLMKLNLEQVNNIPISKHNIIRVSSAEQLNSWIKIIAQIDGCSYADVKKLIDYLSIRSKTGSLRLYLALRDGVPVGTSAALLHDDIVTIHMVGVLPEFRKRGHGAALTMVPLAECAEQDVKYAYLCASATPFAEPLYKKLGFYNYRTFHLYIYKNPEVNRCLTN